MSENARASPAFSSTFLAASFFCKKPRDVSRVPRSHIAPNIRNPAPLQEPSAPLRGFFLMFGARKMSENARASPAFSSTFLAASYMWLLYSSSCMAFFSKRLYSASSSWIFWAVILTLEIEASWLKKSMMVARYMLMSASAK